MHYIKHDEDNNSQFKFFYLNQNYNRSSSYIKSLDRFQDNFRTFPEFETLSRFREKTHFSVFDNNPQFKTKLIFITYKINH